MIDEDATDDRENKAAWEDQSDWMCEPDDHEYEEVETAPLGVRCIRCGHFIGAWET